MSGPTKCGGLGEEPQDSASMEICWPGNRSYRVHLRISEYGWQRQAESSELADGVHAYAGAIGKLRLPLPPKSWRRVQRTQ